MGRRTLEHPPLPRSSSRSGPGITAICPAHSYSEIAGSLAASASPALNGGLTLVVGVAGNKGRAERRIPRGRSFPLRLWLVEVPCHERHRNRRTTRRARGRDRDQSHLRRPCRPVTCSSSSRPIGGIDAQSGERRRADVGVRGQYAPADSDDSGVFFRLAWKQVPD